ncbi:MAG: hypothetical protein NVSMB22_24180 [Chloroflexota bacterium]
MSLNHVMDQPSSFVYRLRGFTGSAEALRSEIDRGRLRPVDMQLAPVAEGLKTYALQADRINLDDVGLHLQFVSRLVAAKSAALLPQSQAESGDTASTTDYRIPAHPLDIGHAVLMLGERQGYESFPRESQMSNVPRLVEPRSPVLLQRAWREMRKRVDAGVTRVSPPSFVRLEVAVSRLIRRMKSSSRLSFRSLTRGSNRNDVVIHFLAVLELVKRRRITAIQTGLFAEISLEPAQNSDETIVRAG